MKIKKLIKSGIRNLAINKLRTGLAILGIVIGIGSVIAMVSIGEASKVAVQSRIQSIGSNLLTVSPGSASSGMIRGSSSVQTLTLDDAEAIKTAATITTIKTVSPEYSSRSQIIAGRNNTNTTVIGVTSAYASVHKITMSSGTFITDTQSSSGAKVAVLGPTTVDDLFGDTTTNPVGQTIRIGGKSFQIIGVTTSKGGSGMNNQDDRIYIPLSTAQKQVFGVKYLSSIALEATNENVMTAAQDQVGYFLMERHKISDVASIDFRIQSQADILETATAVTGTFTTMLAGVAAISLLVGGIGIMNIMLMSVTERTREIGLRKALGAKKKTIITQFLVESILLTFTGGVIGIALGIIGFYIYARVNDSTFVVSANSVFLAFGVSTAIGILFGWYPARIAANLQPIEALRYE